jgi:hypothetical protein
MKRSSLVVCLILFAMLVMSGIAAAATRTSSASGLWSSTTTWGGNPAPTATDDVIINGNFTVTVDVPNASCLSLQLGGSTLGTGTGTLAFNALSHLTVSAPVVLGVTTNTPGSVNMTSGGTLTCGGLVDTRVGTWTAGTGTVEFNATNTEPKTNTIQFNHLLISAGTTTLQRNTTVAGTLTIAPGAAMDGGANTLTVSGDWTNNGNFIGSTSTVTFAKNGDQFLQGTGTNHFNLMRVSLGATINNVLRITASQFDAPPSFLTLVNGQLRVSGSFTFANTFLAGPGVNVPAGTGLWIDNPNVTVLPQGGNLSLRGLLRLTQGTVQVGNAADSSLVYQGVAPQLTIEGGLLDVAGRICGNNATAVVAYTQSGGTVIVNEQGSTDAVFAPFDIGVAGSSFTLSAGSIIVRNRGAAPTDFKLGASTTNVTGGTLQIGDALTSDAQVIRVQSSRTLGSLLVSNATAAPTKPVAQLLGSSLNLAGGVTVQSGTTLDMNGFGISLGGDWLDQGSVINTNAVTFNGAGAQAVSRSGGETFGTLGVNKPSGTLTLGSNVTVTGSAVLTQGAIAVGANTFALNGPVSGASTITSAASGTVNYAQTSAGQTVLAGAYGNLVFSNFAKVLPAATIGVGGTFTPGSGSGHTVAGSTFDFTGAAQGVPVFPYENLSLSGAGAKTGTGALIATGNFAQSAGVTFSGTTSLELDGTTHTVAGALTTGALTLGSGATLTNSGTVNTGALLGAGTFTQGATGILGASGAVTIAALQAAAAGNAVTYSGAGQTVAASAYHHLTLSGSGAVSLAGVSVVHGDLGISGTVAASAGTGLAVDGNTSVAAGAALDLGAFAHTFKGNFNAAGTLTSAAASVTFSGTAPQAFTGGALTGLTLANAAGLALGGDASVSGALTLTNGALAIGAHTLTVNGALSSAAGTLTGGASSNLVIGGAAAAPALPALTLASFAMNRTAGATLNGDLNVQSALTLTNGVLGTGANKVVLAPAAILSEAPGQVVLGNVTITKPVAATSGTEIFGGIGADVTMHGVALGSTTVLRHTGVASLANGHSSILRNFDITPAVNTALKADLTFHHDASEDNGQNAGLLELYRSRDGGVTWNNLGGVANATAHTVSVAGVNDFSRWTAADTSNRLGNSATPVLASIAPNARNLGDGAFTLTVNGSDFVSGKSAVRFNGSARPTTFVSPTQLTAAIPASDLVLLGAFPVMVATADGGGVSNAISLTVNPIPASLVAVETAADGSGTVVPAQSLASGTGVTVYAISRDSFHNFVANVAGTWSLSALTGGVVAGDLVAAADGKSAVFTGHVIGSGVLNVASTTLTATPSGAITVTPGAASRVRVETLANGAGVVVPAQSLASGSSLSVFAVSRDASNNFVANVAATAWSFGSITGGVVAGDLVAAADQKSATLTGHVIGSAAVQVASGALAATPSGVVTVTPGTASKVRVETLANGAGVVVPAQSLASGSPLTVFAVTRDASNNFVANVAASSWALENFTGGVVAGDLVAAVDQKSATFTGHAGGSADIRAASAALTQTPSGVITVTSGVATQVAVETSPDGLGSVVAAQNVTSGAGVTGYAVARDASHNFVANVAGTWSVGSPTGGIVAGDLVAAADGKSAVFTGHVIGSGRMQVASAALVATASGVLTVTPGVATKVRVETLASGAGIVVPAQSLASGSSLTCFAISRDASNNFVANVAATSWNLGSITGGVVASDLVAAADLKSATFTGHVIGSAAVQVASGVLTATPSGTITVTSGTATQVSVETLANGAGVVVPAQSIASGSALTAYAITRDASNNFVANVAATSWVLENRTGGVVAGDLVVAADLKSATLTGHAGGTADIRATSAALTQTPSGVISVISGTAAKVAVETSPDGLGSVVGAQNLTAGASLTVYAVARDASNNFVANVAGGWSVAAITGGVVAGDLVPAADAKSAVLTGHVIGSASIQTSFASLPTTGSGTITVVTGAATQVRVETAANGSGSVVAPQSIVSGTSLTLFAVSRDVAGNFVANVAATSWGLTGTTGGVALTDLVAAVDKKSAAFTGHVIGTVSVRALATGLTAVPSGVLTVTAGAAAKVRVETLADGTGAVVPATPVATNAALTVYAITRDASNNFIANATGAAWSLQSITGGVVAANLAASADSSSATFSSHAVGSAVIRATLGVLAATPSGVVSSTGIAGVGGAPVAFALQQNFPNPFTRVTTIRFAVPKVASVRLSVYDVAGRQVAQLLDEVKSPGEYAVRWESSSVRSGTYFYRLESDGHQMVRKMLVMQ